MAVSSTSSGSLKTGVCLSTDRPDNPFTGQVIFETDTGKVYVWAGSTWVNIGDTSGEGVQLPSGTTAERPSSPTAGQMRFNETTGEPEWYSSSAGIWVNFRNKPVFDISYLVIAGGGGSGRISGGGGAGGYRSSVLGEVSGGGATPESPLEITLNTSYTVTVGAGGAGVNDAPPNSGSNSAFGTVTSLGGGGAGVYNGTTYQVGQTGGSGGGNSLFVGSAGSGTPNQGFDGGAGDTAGPPYSFGGGGGAGAVGGNSAGGNVGADGGAGLYSSITGSSVPRGGGGGGSGETTGGAGGVGGGGEGSDGATNTGTNGDPNTGGGAGGQRATSGYSGGSGVVILRYQSGLSPTVSAGLTSTTTTVGNDKVTVFTAGTGTVSWG